MNKAVIFDIDGTLAEKGDRSPYDWSKVGEDKPIQPIIDLLHLFQKDGYKIIVFSGRDSVCMRETELWLEKNEIFQDLLFMRTERDNSPDYMVKENFYGMVKGDFDIRYVVDDRLQVCKLWHRLGLTLLRVGDPESNF